MRGASTGNVGRQRFDPDVLATLAFRGWSIVSGLLMLVCIPIWLTPDEQGYYYTFANLIALQIFFELGLNQVVLQLVSHDYAVLKQECGETEAPLQGIAERRISSLIVLLRRWYAVAAVLFVLLVGAGGTVFFLQNGRLAWPIWLGPWLTLTAATAVNLYYSAQLTVVEGMGRLAGVAKMRTAQSMIGLPAAVIVLIAGEGLWAAVMVPTVAAIFTAYWIHEQPEFKRSFAQVSSFSDAKKMVDWRKDIFPMQWRIALSWMSGYFIFQLFTPLTFAHHGAVVAGQLGIALAVFSALNSLSLSWIYAKAPMFGQLIADRQRDRLDALFRHVMVRSLAFFALASGGVAIVYFGASSLELPILRRFTSPDVAVCLAMASAGNVFVFGAATYMRAHKEEPMLMVSAVSSLLIAVSAFAVVPFGVRYMVLAYAVVTLLVTLPWTLTLYSSYRARVAL